MIDRKKEFAKFFCGFEAFHTFVLLYLLLSGTTMTVLGITTSPALNVGSIILNAAISLVLALYAWRPK